MHCRHNSDTCLFYEAEKAEFRCEITGCTEEAIYEGWFRLRDCLGLPTGHLVLMQICSTHSTHPWLVANEKPKVVTDGSVGDAVEGSDQRERRGKAPHMRRQP